MASESTRERTVTITLPAELDDWLEEQVTARDTDRETLLGQLLAAYRTTANGELDGEVRALDDGALTDRIEDQINEQLSGELETVADLQQRVEAVDEEYDQKLSELHNRVVQLTQAVEETASADHTHAEFDQIQEVTARTEALGSEVEDLREVVDSREEQLSDIAERLNETEDRLQSVAWLVNDLRDTVESDGLDATDRIKRTAAEKEIDRANCENCGETVTIALLTEPECPHCHTAVRDVEPSSGWFGKPELRAASELDSGDNDE